MTREEKIRKALSKKRKTNRWGMTAQEIRDSFQKKNKQKPKTRDATTNRRVVTASKKKKPTKSLRPQLMEESIRLLLESPVPNTQGAIHYPTPSWFQNKEKVDVSVIVPLYKSDELIKDLIDSWDHENDGLKVEFVFVDDCCPNNSKEATLRHCERRKERFKRPVGKLLYNPQNQGFGITCNTGVYHASGEFIILLNSDTTVTKSWIKPMIRLFKDEKVGIVGNLQIKSGGEWDGHIDGAGSEWHWEDRTFHHIGRHSYNGQKIQSPFHPNNCPEDILKNVSEREMVTGCCIAMRKSLFEEIGGFNPNYRIGYWEDSDLCMTVKELGYKVMYTPNSVIHHKLSQSGSGGHPYQRHNQKYFDNKWIATGRIDSFVRAPRPSSAQAVKSILIKRDTANGDVLAATGIVPALKKKHPECKVFFSTNQPKVIEGNPDIDGLVSDHELVDRIFQIYFNLDMVYEQRPHTNIMQSYADHVGVNIEDCTPFIDTKKVEGLPQKYIAIHAGKTNWVGRDWAKSKFDIISSRLMKEGHKVVSVGHGRDHEIYSDINFSSKTDIHELAYIIQNSELFIGIDSFPMHVAQALGVPGVCFFGSIIPETRIYNDNMQGVQAVNLNCLGCHHRKPAPSTVTNICETDTLDCVNKVSVEEMMNAIKEKLNENNTSAG